MRKRLRKKRHRSYLEFVCGWVLTLDEALRADLLASETDVPIRISSDCAAARRRPGTPRGLRFVVAVVTRRPYGLDLVCWPEEFPAVREPLVLNHSPPVWSDGRWVVPDPAPQPTA